MESPKPNEKKDDSSYLFLHNLLNSISKNIWKNKYIGYAFLVGINGLFFISFIFYFIFQRYEFIIIIIIIIIILFNCINYNCKIKLFKCRIKRVIFIN